MSVRERADSVESLLRSNDAALVVALMVGIYVLFTFFGLVLGLDLNGLVNTLRRITFLAAVYAMLSLALNLHWGYTGLFNIGIAGFMAVGVYTMAMLTGPVNPGPTGVPGLGLPLPVGIVGGMIAAALVGLVAALPALRLKADYLAIVTVALSEIIRFTYLSTTFQRFSVAGVEIGTGGGQGITLPDNPIRVLFYVGGDAANGTTALGAAVFGMGRAVGISDPVVINVAYTVVLVGFVGLFYWLLVRIGNSPFGRVLKAIREDETVAGALGKDTQLFKIKTFMVGCALMGLAGILWRGSQGFTNPGAYRPIQTFYVFLALIIGGAGSNTGSVVGGAVFAALLFEGPIFLGRVVSQVFAVRGGANTIADAIGALGSLDVMPLVGYVITNVSTLRFVLLGAVIVYLMQNRPDGLLGHRKEVAAAIDVSRAGRGSGGTGGGGGSGSVSGSGSGGSPDE